MYKGVENMQRYIACGCGLATIYVPMRRTASAGGSHPRQLAWSISTAPRMSPRSPKATVPCHGSIMSSHVAQVGSCPGLRVAS